MGLNVSVWRQEIVSLCVVEKWRCVFFIPIKWHWRIQQALSYKIASWEGISGDGEVEREGGWLTRELWVDLTWVGFWKRFLWSKKHWFFFIATHLTISGWHCLSVPCKTYLTFAKMIHVSSLWLRVGISGITAPISKVHGEENKSAQAETCRSHTKVVLYTL